MQASDVVVTRRPIELALPLPIVVAGLDLSLTGAAVAVVDPRRWRQSLRRVATARFGRELKGSKETADTVARVDRLIEISHNIVDFLYEHGATHVWLENYSFGMRFNSHQLGEIGGCVKHEIRRRLGIVAAPVSNTTARKLLLGRGAGKGIKLEVERQLAAMGGKFKTNDEGDAFVVANWGLSELGFPALMLAR